MKFIDRSGMRFGRLIVKDIAYRKDKHIYWNCVCDCGKEIVVVAALLRIKGIATRSCGCLRADVTRAKATIHGFTALGNPLRPFFYIWHGMKGRCSDPHNKHYWRYGGRGIECRVADAQALFDIVGPRPSSKHTVDRVDNDGHYVAGNLRWATKSEQNYNKRYLRLRDVMQLEKENIELRAQLTLDLNASLLLSEC